MKYIYLALFLLIGRSVFAQDYRPVQDEASFYTMLNKIAAETETIQCDFVQEKQLSFMEQAMVSSGKMYFAGNDQLRWEYTEPYNYAVLMVSDKLVIIDEGNVNQMKLGKNPAFKRIQQLMTKTLRGDVAADDGQFDKTVEENDKYIRLRMVPTDASMKSFISSMELYFSKDKFIMEKFVMDENGDKTTTTLSHQQINAPIDASVFAW